MKENAREKKRERVRKKERSGRASERERRESDFTISRGEFIFISVLGILWNKILRFKWLHFFLCMLMVLRSLVNNFIERQNLNLLREFFSFKNLNGKCQLRNI